MSAENRAKKRQSTRVSVLVLISMLLAVAGASAQAPVNKAVTTPIQFFGYEIGEDYKITPWQAHELTGEGLRQGCVEYMRELERTSNRVRTFEYGATEMGKPMVLMVITAPENWARIDRLKEILTTLADPRQVGSDEMAQALAAEGKPVYWLAGSIHSSERTSTEVLLRLGYKLAAYNDDWTRNIVDNLIVILETSISPDGVDLVTDWYYDYLGTEWDGTRPPSYNWYVGHDNNRDFLGLALAESQNNVRMRFEWNPTVYHDLHEAMTMLYMSPGPDPTNEAVNGITMEEWLGFAGHNMAGLAAKGWPGVFTYDYADMWYPGYNHGFSFMHNTNGRFYELQGARMASPRVISREGRPRSWFNPYPLTEEFLPLDWHLMDAVNLEEDAIKLDLEYAVENKAQLLYNFYMKGKRNMEQAARQLYAYVVPANGGDNADVTDMINNLLMQGIEVHRAGEAFSVGGRDYMAGDYVILMEQPYGLTAHNFLQIHEYPPIKTPYDVTTWTYGIMRDAETVPVGEAFAASLIAVAEPVPYDGELVGDVSQWYLLEHGSNNNLARALPRLFADPAMAVSQLDTEVTVGDKTFPMGTFMVQTSGSGEDAGRLEALAEELGLTVQAIPGPVDAAPLSAPRIGVYTTNNSDLMQEGWTRLRLDKGSEFAYTRLFPIDVVNPGSPLEEQYDVIVLPDIRTRYLVRGSSRMPPGYQLGLGEEGVANLKAFVENGGTLLCMGKASDLPMEEGWDIGVQVPELLASFTAAMEEQEPEEPPDFGWREPGVRLLAAEELNCPGSLLRIQVDPTTLVGYGYDAEEAVWCDGSTRYFVLEDSAATAVAWYPEEGALLLSGYLTGGDVLRGKAAMVDAPLGAGRVILLGPNTLYRAQITGDFMFFFNSLISAGR